MTDTVLKGLAAIQKELAKRPQGGDFEDKPKARYVNVEKDKSIKLTPLQEIDEGSPNYLEDNGLAVFVLMHSNPDNWQKSAKRTAELGDCYGCKMGWRQKVLLFVNVLVDDGKEDPYVAIFNRGLGKGSVAQALLDMAADDDFNMSITDKTFKFTRTGEKKNTTYSLSPLPKPHGMDLSSFKDDLYDLEKYVFTVSPERQEAYYLDGQVADSNEASKAKVPAGAADVDADW